MKLLTLRTGLGAAALAGCGSSSAPAAATVPVAATSSAPAPVATKTVQAPAPTPVKTVYVQPKPARTVYVQPVAPVQQFTNAVSVVDQLYQDITDHAYPAAWALGGRYIGGQSYDSWVAGYSTTASVSLYDTSEFGSGQVTAYLSAVQTDGSTRTYYVTDGVITSADIAQTS